MKIKYYLMGLGVGIILTTLILSFGIKNNRLSDQEIMKEAAKLGMVMKEDQDILPKDSSGSGNPSVTPSPAAAQVTLTPSAEPNKTGNTKDGASAITPTSVPKDAEPSVTPVPTVTQVPEISVAPKPTDIPISGNNTSAANQDKVAVPTSTPAEDTAAAVYEEGKLVTFTITPGMSSNKVAQLLEQKGIVKSAEDFNKYVLENGKAEVISTGTFTLPEGSDYPIIVKMITK